LGTWDLDLVRLGTALPSLPELQNLFATWFLYAKLSRKSGGALLWFCLSDGTVAVNPSSLSPSILRTSCWSILAPKNLLPAYTPILVAPVTFLSKFCLQNPYTLLREVFASLWERLFAIS
jgi:hypothetical protein